IISNDTAQTFLLAVQRIVVECPFCGKVNVPNVPICAYCDTSLLQKPLLIDRYPNLSDALLARIGMGEALAEQGKTADALLHWQAAVDALPVGHNAAESLHLLHDRLLDAAPAAGKSSLEQLIDGFDADLIAHINQTRPDEWLTLTPQKRAALVRRLIAADHL